MLTMHLAQDENDCFSAVSAREVGLALEESEETKVNYGQLLLQALLEHWPRPFQLGDEANPDGPEGGGTGASSHPPAISYVAIHRPGNEYYSVAPHIPVIFRYEFGGSTSNGSTIWLTIFEFYSEVGGRTLYRLLCRDADGETEGTLLTESGVNLGGWHSRQSQPAQTDNSSFQSAAPHPVNQIDFEKSWKQNVLKTNSQEKCLAGSTKRQKFWFQTRHK